MKNAFDFSEYTNMITPVNPVHIFNFDDITKQHLIGIILMSNTAEEIENMLKEKEMRDNITNNSILLFESRHRVETAHILCGAFRVILESFTHLSVHDKHMHEKEVLDYRNKSIMLILESTGKPIYYYDFFRIIDNICDYIEVLCEPVMYARINAILRNIWFVPYGALDEIFEKYKEDNVDKLNNKDGNKNE